MPTAPNPSARFRKAASAERDRLLRRRAKVDERRAHLREELLEAEDQLHQLDEQIGALQALAGEPRIRALAPPDSRLEVEHLSGASAPRTLRGSAIRETAVRILVDAGQGDRPIHYKDWLKMLRDGGYEVIGKRPDAVFLNQISRSPVVKSTTTAGLYQLDIEAPKRLRSLLAKRQAQLRHSGALDPSRLEDLALEIRRTQRALQEAENSLHSGDQSDEAAA